MEDGDTEKYRAQDFVFLSRKGGCIRCISLQVYNKEQYQINLNFPFQKNQTVLKLR